MDTEYSGECKEIRGINNEVEELKKLGEFLAINVDSLYDRLSCILVPAVSTKNQKVSPLREPLSLLSEDIKSVGNIQRKINDRIEELLRRLDV